MQLIQPYFTRFSSYCDGLWQATSCFSNTCIQVFDWTLSSASFPNSKLRHYYKFNLRCCWWGGGICNLLLNSDLWNNFVLSMTPVFPLMPSLLLLPYKASYKFSSMTKKNFLRPYSVMVTYACSTGTVFELDCGTFCLSSLCRYIIFTVLNM